MGRMNTTPIKKKVNFNIGLGLDIPTGFLVTGREGETIVNGGLDNTFMIVGPTNSFKTTILVHIALTILNRFFEINVEVEHHDTEVNSFIERINDLAKQMENLDVPIASYAEETTGNELWNVTDKSQYFADEWLALLREMVASRAKEKLIKFNALKTEMLSPILILIDSFSEFEPSVTALMGEENAKKGKDDSSNNTLDMKRGGYRNRVISEFPRMAARGGLRFLLSAHIGKKINMDGPYAPQETKQISFLKQNEYIKGVAPKALYLITNVWYASTGIKMINKGDKLPEYPNPGEESLQETDLLLVYLTPLKTKSGPSGYRLPVVISQKEGPLDALSAFHYCKMNGKFGFGGTDRSFYFVFYPERSMSRRGDRAVRGILKSDSRAAQAVILLRGLHQLKLFHPSLVKMGIWCEPEVLYNDLKEMGYDWNKLLDSREWMAPDNYSKKLKTYLSIVDLLYLRKGIGNNKLWKLKEQT